MKILVTGGAGFIASNIADRYIEHGHDVHIIDNLSSGSEENINPSAIFHKEDIRNTEFISSLFEKEKFDLISHHAAQMNVRFSVENPQEDADNNIIGSINLYEAARKNGVRKIIFASTGGAVYGEQDYFPANEEHPLRPCSPYGITKLTNEKYLYYYKEEYGIDHVILRYTNVYGPRQNPHGEAGVVAIFTERMLNNVQAFINGDGRNTRDYIYIDDLVDANALALNDDMTGIFNVSTALEVDVNEIFLKLRELTGSNMEKIHADAKPGEQRRSVCTYEKLKTNFNWEPKVDLGEGLKRTVEFFKNK